MFSQLTGEGMFLLVVVHWKTPDEALVSSAPVVGVQGDVIVMLSLHLPPGSAALALTAPLGCPANITISFPSFSSQITI